MRSFPGTTSTPAVKKSFLTEDYLMESCGPDTRIDCRQPVLRMRHPAQVRALRRENPGEVWECPEVRSPQRAPKLALPVEVG